AALAVASHRGDDAIRADVANDGGTQARVDNVDNIETAIWPDFHIIRLAQICASGQYAVAATVAAASDGGDHAIAPHAADTVVAAVSDVEGAVRPHGHSFGCV